MKYYAELLRSLNTVTLSIDVDWQIDADIRSLSGKRLVLGGPGQISEIIYLPSEVGPIDITVSANQRSVRMKMIALNQGVYEKQIFKKFVPPKLIMGLPLPELKWKRLPSEYWAELMDIWHCHKPEGPSEAQDSIYKLAMNGFHPKPGLAYYSDTYYLLHESDLKAQLKQGGLPNSGTPGSSTIKLWRWDVSETGAVAPFIGAMVAELTDAHACFTFVVNSDLMLWVLNADTEFTFTGCHEPLRGAKVFYGDFKTHSTDRPDAEIIQIPEDAYKKLCKELDYFNAQLPFKMREIGGWKLSLLGESCDTSATQP